MSLGLKLVLLRENLGLTTTEVAKAANMRTEYYEKIEDDEIDKPHPLTLEKIADALGTTLSDLLNKEDMAASLEDELTPFQSRLLMTLIVSCLALGFVCVTAIAVSFLTAFVRYSLNAIQNM